MKKRICGALCALTLAAALACPAYAATYSVTLTAEEASADVPCILPIPALTPAAPGTEPDRIVLSAPVENAAVEITVSGEAKNADVLHLNADGTYATAEDTVVGASSLYTMIPGTSATLIVLEKPAFTDLSRTAWYYGGVAYVCHNGLMSGVSSTKFSPNTAATRAQLVTILWRLEGEPAAAGAVSFQDVKDGQYYTQAVLWAAENNVVTGSNQGNFSPNGTMTREQLAVMLYRYAQYRGLDTSVRADLSGYNDAAKVGSWAADAMAWAVEEGLITGSNQNNLDPTGSATRAQLATILMRFLEAGNLLDPPAAEETPDAESDPLEEAESGEETPADPEAGSGAQEDGAAADAAQDGAEEADPEA